MNSQKPENANANGEFPHAVDLLAASGAIKMRRVGEQPYELTMHTGWLESDKSEDERIVARLLYRGDEVSIDDFDGTDFILDVEVDGKIIFTTAFWGDLREQVSKAFLANCPDTASDFGYDNEEHVTAHVLNRFVAGEFGPKVRAFAAIDGPELDWERVATYSQDPDLSEGECSPPAGERG